MKQSDLVREVSRKVGVSQVVTKEVVSALLDTIGEELRNGEPVRLTGLGVLRPAKMAARVYVYRYVDDDTGEKMEERVPKPERQTVRFRVSKVFRESMNQ